VSSQYADAQQKALFYARANLPAAAVTAGAGAGQDDVEMRQ